VNLVREIVLPGGTVVVVGRPFQGPTGGTVLALSVARRLYHRPCLHGLGPNYAIVGTNHADRIKGTRRSERILGLGGPDRIAGQGGSDGIDGGAGIDRHLGRQRRQGSCVRRPRKRPDLGSERRRVRGRSIRRRPDLPRQRQRRRLRRPGNDRIAVGRGDDKIWGGAGNDRLYGRGEVSWMYCGSGKDTAYVTTFRASDHPPRAERC
jgi:hypothetical protein